MPGADACASAMHLLTAASLPPAALAFAASATVGVTKKAASENADASTAKRVCSMRMFTSPSNVMDARKSWPAVHAIAQAPESPRGQAALRVRHVSNDETPAENRYHGVEDRCKQPYGRALPDCPAENGGPGWCKSTPHCSIRDIEPRADEAREISSRDLSRCWPARSFQACRRVHPAPRQDHALDCRASARNNGGRRR